MKYLFLLIITFWGLSTHAQRKPRLTLGTQNIYSGTSVNFGYAFDFGPLEFNPSLRWVASRSANPVSSLPGVDLNIHWFYQIDERISGGFFGQYSFLHDKDPVTNMFHELYGGLCTRYFVSKHWDLRLRSGAGGYMQRIGTGPAKNSLKGLSYCLSFGVSYYLPSRS